MCSAAMEAGAYGVTFGRNVFQHPNPQAMVSALREIVIERRTTREAMLYLDRKKG